MLSRNWLLNVTVVDNKIVKTEIDDKGRKFVNEIETSFPLYIAPYKRKLETIEKTKCMLEEIPFVKKVQVEEWFFPPWYEKREPVIKIEVNQISHVYLLEKMLREKNIGKRINYQPPIEVLAFRKHGLVPCTFENEDPWNIDYEVPTLRVGFIKLYGNNIKKIAIYNYEVGLEEERLIYRDFLEEEDVLGNQKMINNLHILFDPDNIIKTPKNNGIVVIRKQENPIESMHGLIELCRLSSLPLGRVALSSIGEILTTIESLHALEEKKVIPYVRENRDYWRTIGEIIDYDRGGLVGTPFPGIYENVIQLDFSSLYPNIIAKNNISPETVNNPYCDNYYKRDELPHPICLEKKGIVSQVLKKLVERREELKKRKEYVYTEREKALKWIMVASFGYLGYRNSRFGSLHAYENVTSIARQIITKSIEISEKLGYTVIHYIVDSLFLKPENPKISEDGLVKKIREDTGYKLKLEGKYIWLVIPETKTNLGNGASNRYYGLKENMELVIKGSRCGWKKSPVLIDRKKTWKLAEYLYNHNSPRKLCEDLERQASKLGLKVYIMSYFLPL